MAATVVPLAPTADRQAEASERQCHKMLAETKIRAKRRRDPWLSIFQEVYDYSFPYRQGFYEDTEGSRKTNFIYDQTAVVSVPRFASRIQHGLFPPQADAFVFLPGVDVPEADRSVDMQGELDKISNAMHEGLRNSNFESELHEGAQDLAVGTLTLLVEPGTWPGDLRFTAVPINHLYILPGADDMVGGWFYEHRKSYAEIAATWPRAKHNAAMAQAMRNNPDAKTRVYQVTLTRRGEGFEKEYDYYLWAEEHGCVMAQYTYRGEGSCPWITARWSKTAMEVWGRGPLLQVLPSVKTCNLVVQMVLENAEMAIAGLYAYDDDGVFNPENVRVEPGTFIPRMPGSKVEPLSSPSRFDVSSLVLNDERMNIKKGLFVDELDAEGKTPRSAEEISQRMADMARNMGSVSGRLRTELMLALVRRIAYIYRKQGLIDMPEIDGKAIRLVPLSPLLRIQDQAEISNFIQYTQVLNGTMGPGYSQIALKPAETLDWLTRKFGIPAHLIDSQGSIKQKMAEIAQGAAATGNTPELMKTAVEGGLKTSPMG
jgi:hypothetical protein